MVGGGVWVVGRGVGGLVSVNIMFCSVSQSFDIEIKLVKKN